MKNVIQFLFRLIYRLYKGWMYPDTIKPKHMKKSILILALMLMTVALFAQTDTVVVEDDVDADIPDWISYAINAVLIAVSAWLTKAKLRLGKAVTLLQTLASVAERPGTVTSVDLQDVITQAKELIAKEK